jgi:hypothetical protein
VTAEGLSLSTGFDEKRVLALIVIYVVMAFLAQAAIGGLCSDPGCWLHGSVGLLSIGTWRGWSCFP